MRRHSGAIRKPCTTIGLPDGISAKARPALYVVHSDRPACSGAGTGAAAAGAGAPLEIYGIGGGPRAVGSVAVDGLEFGPAALHPLMANGAGAAIRLLSVIGAENEGIDMQVEDGALDPALVAQLRQDFGLELPVARGTVAWTTTGKGNGRSSIDVSLQAVPGKAGAPEVAIEHAGDRFNAGMRIKVRRAVAVVQFSVLLGDDVATAGQPGAAPAQNALRIAGGPTLPLPDALPITVVAAEGSALTLIFPVGAPNARFYLGGSSDAAPRIGKDKGVRLRDAAVRRSDGSDKWYACAAQKKAIFVLPRALRSGDCADAATLRAHDLTLAPTQVALQIKGDGFLVKDGTARTVDWLARLERNKLAAALLGLVYAALAKWVWGVFARPRGAAS